MNGKPEPKFVPGERVQLVSKHFPECNGEYVVDRMVFLPLAEDLSGNVSADVWAYELHGLSGIWGEVALRKLPPDEPTTWEDGVFQPQLDEVTT